MRQDLWRTILAARGDVDKLVAAAVGDYPRRPPPRAPGARPGAPGVAVGPQLVRSGPGGGGATAMAGALNAPRAMSAVDTARLWIDPARPVAATIASTEQETLVRLHHDVLARVEALRATMVTEPGGEQAMLVLLLFFDERIMGQLPEFLATSWPLLQSRVTGRKTGGSDFFVLIDRMLESEQAPGFAVEVTYWCLANGFQGQYADDLASLEAYRERLRGRITVPELPRPPVEPVVAASQQPIKSPMLYYLVAVVVVVLTAVALTIGSNT